MFTNGRTKMQQINRKAYLNLPSLFILNTIKNLKTEGEVQVIIDKLCQICKGKGPVCGPQLNWMKESH